MSERGGRRGEGGCIGHQEHTPEYGSSLTPMGRPVSWTVRAGQRLYKFRKCNNGAVCCLSGFELCPWGGRHSTDIVSKSAPADVAVISDAVAKRHLGIEADIRRFALATSPNGEGWAANCGSGIGRCEADS